MRRAFARLRATQKGALGFAPLQSPAPVSENGVGFAPRAMARHSQLCCEHDFRGHKWNKFRGDVFQWVFLSGPADHMINIFTITIAQLYDWKRLTKSSTLNSLGNLICRIDGYGREIVLGGNFSRHVGEVSELVVMKNRDLMSVMWLKEGNVEQAEKFFRSALEEAREGFGERDPHVASACNNLAEFFRLKKDFESAEPLYLEAINILEKHFGIDDIRELGHNNTIQRKLEKARVCYEIKRRVLGEAHTEYADTMYHLGTVLPANTAVLSLLTVMGFASVLSLLSISANTVLHLQGKEKDAEDLIVDSIRILEAGGRGESFLCLRRMQYLAQGWKSFDTVVAAERLALVLQTAGKLREAEELLERCLGARKKLLPDEHIQSENANLQPANEEESSRAMAELDMAKDLLHKCVRVARHVLAQVVEQKGNKGPTGIPKNWERRAFCSSDTTSILMVSLFKMQLGKEGKDMLVSLGVLTDGDILQSLNALGSLEIMKLEFPGAREYMPAEAEAALCQCVSTYKE
ncbi:UNVERIFIED_CONTAM: hypothetical protein Scaly_0154200, partial [Sesamum calycinum]